MKRTFGSLLILLALALFALNGYGLTTSLRPEAIAPYAEAQGKRIISLDEFRRVAEADTSDRAAYVTRLTMTLHAGVVHSDADYEPRLHTHDYTIPVQENYILWAYQFRGERFDHWMFSDPYRAFEKGYGLCSDYALMLSGVLLERGIPARIVEIRDHVVVTAEIAPGEWWVLDADFGVVIPHSLEAMKRDPALVDAYYDTTIGNYLAASYLSERRDVYHPTDYRTGTTMIENLSYGAIWLLPILLLLEGVLLLLSRPGASSYEYSFK